MAVKSPDELKGLRIRTSPMYIDFLKALGTTPISTSPGDIYQAMERKVVDGFCWPFTKVRDWGFHEVTKHVIGPSFYAKLDRDQRRCVVFDPQRVHHCQHRDAR